MMGYAEKKSLFGSMRCLSLSAASLFLGCEPPPEPQNHSASQPVSAADANEHIALEKQVEAQGGKLTDVAGQATLNADQPKLKNIIVPEYAKVFIGRFHASIPCDDGFIPCKQGTAEYILNLLPDGTVHRSIIHYGKVFTDKPMTEDGNTTYRKDMWALDEELQEIIVHRKEGVNFYYTIQDRDHLVMNVEKISSDREGRNQELFNKGYPQPAKAYVLTRDQNSQ